MHEFKPVSERMQLMHQKGMLSPQAMEAMNQEMKTGVVQNVQNAQEGPKAPEQPAVQQQKQQGPVDPAVG